MSEMISFGAGVNSVAMTIMLVNEGWRGPIVFADTGGEHPETYCYMTTFERDWLKPRGLEITRISPETHPGLYLDKRLREHVTLEDYCLWRGIIPLRAVKWCSVMFKVDPMNAYIKSVGLSTRLVGMCADEPQRVRTDGISQYPLADRGITREECRRITQRAGLDAPSRSSCFFCPNTSAKQWKRLSYEHPDLFDRSIALEDNAMDRQQAWHTLRDELPLRELRERRWQGQTEMDLSEWMPCACVL